MPFDTVKDLLQQPEISTLFQEVVDGINAELARYERIREFRLLPESLTVESGFLTPTLKVKRPMVNERFADLIDSIYPG
ncbi:MAG: hypothetical protein IFK93_06945 [Acidobacteria bacterium]|nr:hypothetical protein [Candidatus Sulfomarinibacter kjeldsenii]